MTNVIAELYGKRKGHAMPSPKSVEEEFADYVPKEVRREVALEGSTKMEKMKELLTTGLTAAYKDGATALEAAIKDAADAVAQKQARSKALDEELDAFKRTTAEQIMQYAQRAKEITAEVDANIEHLREMTKWSEEQRARSKNPAPPVALPPPPVPPPVPGAPVQTSDD